MAITRVKKAVNKHHLAISKIKKDNTDESGII